MGSRSQAFTSVIVQSTGASGAATFGGGDTVPAEDIDARSAPAVKRITRRNQVTVRHSIDPGPLRERKLNITHHTHLPFRFPTCLLQVLETLRIGSGVVKKRRENVKPEASTQRPVALGNRLRRADRVAGWFAVR